ncbi:CHY zinc finger protein [Streptococcus dentapri]|uniref:CHY zinc finger protein n=1 Tax=Streptococcus dentapri TaxID=573564 RepID=A0ABV8D0Z2_9STRE
MSIRIQGLLLDSRSRCQHYHTTLDIVGLKCFDCQRYYACYQCHDSLEDHSFQAYPRKYQQDLVVICGVCHLEMTIEQYQAVSACPSCQSPFNPKCSQHDNIYFTDK